jgi:type VI secretion system secreted protein VgrG
MANGKLMEIKTPLGDDALLFHRMSGREELGRLSEFHLELLSPQAAVDFDKILGQSVTVKLELPKDQTRYFNGFVTRFVQRGMHGRYYVYHATVYPWLWFLTRTANCRIFQEKTVPAILKEVFESHPSSDVKFELTGSYRTWEYCVQYRETDFNFVSRLMEQEGIYYYFKHDEGRATMVLADSYSAHEPFENYAHIPFVQADRLMRPEQERVTEWNLTREIQPGAYVVTDFDFKKPSTSLKVSHKITRNYERSTSEVFDFPGEYDQSADGEHYVHARLEELQAQFEVVHGSTNARGFAVGRLFKLTGQPREDQNCEHLIVKTEIDLESGEYEAMSGSGASYGCRFAVIKSSEAFRPARVTQKPIVQGPQTAIVVGPSGDEIYTDKYGRVKVQFHWDRFGKSDENSSCWIRVSQAWAGKSWGMVALPRMGQEVIVDFLEGDPDEPIITGRVYNAEQMPTYDLPANKTQTGIKSRSSPKGSGANFNEIRFEDKKGSEQLYIHAEKNQDNMVEADATHTVGHDRKKDIGNDETTSVGNNRTEKVGSNETITIGVNRTESVGSNEKIDIGSNRSITVGASETATVALQRTHTVGVNETITVGAAQEITIGALQAVTVGASQTVNVGINQSTSVGANQTNTIGASQTNTIGAKQSTSVGADRSVDVGAAQTVKVGANASMSIGADEAREVSGGRATSVGKDDSLKVTANFVVTAGDSVSISTGDASLTMKKDGTIVLKGKDITIEGSGKIDIKASNNITMKGAKILQN